MSEMRALIVAVLLIPCLQAAHAQSTLPQLQADLVSAWLVTVQGEARTRILRINAVEQKAPEAFVLDAVYGWSDEGQGKIAAELTQVGVERKLSLVTQAQSQITATQLPSGAFSGTFILKSGITKPISLEKVSDEDLKSIVSKAQEARRTLAGADVPASCSAFLGGWAGNWGGGVGPTRLWVTDIKPDCTARVSYLNSSSNTPPAQYGKAQIKDGTLILRCGNNGQCTFTMQGDEIWASYLSGSGPNTALFRKIK